MENNLLVTSSPHLRDDNSTKRIMLDVIIALIPAVLASIYFFRTRALLILAVTVISCVAAEYIACRILKKQNSIGDLSATVTGVLLALNFPSTLPLWIAVVGGFVAIIVVKQLFGGIGQNFMNPALAARVILLISWPVQMTRWVTPGPDAISAATPLAFVKKGAEAAEGAAPGYLELFLGSVGGSLGETSALALLLGAAYLFYRRVITPEIPLAFIGSLGVFMWIFGGDSLFTGDFLYQILAGGVLLGAFFMATDYTTSPVTKKGKLIMGIGCGLLTAIIRLYTSNIEGVSYSILLMNIAAPLIDRYTVPKSFGGEKASA